MLYDYILTLVNDHCLAAKYMAVMSRMEISTDTLTIAAKLYRKIEGMAIKKTGRKVYRSTTNNSLYVRTNKDLNKSIHSRTVGEWHSVNASVKEEIIRSLSNDLYQLLLICTIIAAKYCRDIPFANESWAVVTGINCESVSDKERQILGILDYDIVTGDDGRIRAEIETYLQSEPMGVARVEEGNVIKVVKRIFCF